MPALDELTPAQFCRFLADRAIRRCYFVWHDETETVNSSHPDLEPLGRWLAAERRDFDRHEGVFVQIGESTGALQGAFVHRTCRGQAAGGVRRMRYETVAEYLRDGLRLSRGMTHKNALAGLWWGGGKGVIDPGPGREPDGRGLRPTLYEEYGCFISSLKGCYVTAEDAGTTAEDMAAVFSATRFTTCIPPACGGSGNPSAPTARGVVRGMEAALAHRGQGDLRGKTVVIQGLGEVGSRLIGLLAARGVHRVVGADIRAERIAKLKRAHTEIELDLRVVATDDDSILAEPGDILSPCGVGGTLNSRSIPRIRAGIICGAANNQLEDPDRDDRRLAERGLLFMPDFLVNRMGIVTCADEQAGYINGDPMIEAHLDQQWENGIYRLSLAVLARADESGSTPARIALELAERRSRELHPIFGHRGVEIIRSLIADGWAA
ncbi:MAG: Glu/Leu/Phe/Val dehydrogenase [Acidobacteriota bacterium]|nr:MAG: Glu/Leu/Phe/Val dehydrogenase [Acidobacteriota bacterium]